MTNNFEKDIDVPSKRLDRIDKMEIDLANYEQMERDIEKIIEPYQLNWELDCLSLPSAIQSILERKEQECEELKEILKDKTDKYNKLAVNYDAYVSMANEQLDQLKAELEAYKMEAEEGKEINAELKAENEELKRQHQADKGLITSTGKMNYQLIQEYDKLKEEKQGLIKDWEEKKNLAYEIACKNENPYRDKRDCRYWLGRWFTTRRI